MKNKTVLITGATSGIGKATALKFAEAGANVVVSGRREAEGNAVVEAITSAGGEATFIQADVSNEEDIKNLISKTVGKYGRLDVAFNNAGIETAAPIVEVGIDDYRQVFDINVWGVLASMKHEIPAMLASGGGSIINTSSIVGQVGAPGLSAYTASKHAVEGLTKSAALEHAKEGIRVNAVSPGLIQTDMADRLVGAGESEMRDGFIAAHPIGRVGTPEEIAATVFFLASDGASFITGESIKADGGFTAQ
ncbi:glucose 1-dehydrogenase [Verrucomicrobiales bacterium BCK34]|nr:glucose 1-dehydrogenase [Verrucomicrobiales bacterium BCK34]